VAPFTKTGGGFIPTGILSVDAQLADPPRHLPEPEQLEWLKRTLAEQGRPWHLIGNQVIVTPVRFPGAALGVAPNLTLLNSDQWDGYQADQADLLDGLGHGYTLIDLTPERVQADFYLTPVPTDQRPDPRVDPTVEPVYARSWQTRSGSRRISATVGPVGDRSDEPRDTGGTLY
jgi:hypothetical protein